MPGVEDSLLTRDTDADWREVGRSQPFWGVITAPEYRTENLTPANVEVFYRSGVADIDGIVARIAAATGAPPRGRALDFGCGAGRLAEAMTAHAEAVTGYDVSPGMLAKARERGGRATYVEALPDGPFDWINSFIVFQHIPPDRGLELMEQLLARLAPDGAVSLQVTVWREQAHVWPAARGWRRWFRAPLQRLWARRLPVGQIIMFDYDLSQVVRRLNEAGVVDLTLAPTDHGGHHGVILIGRKTAEPPSRKDVS
jgi:SAM-dependent methyltransferase